MRYGPYQVLTVPDMVPISTLMLAGKRTITAGPLNPATGEGPTKTVPVCASLQSSDSRRDHVRGSAVGATKSVYFETWISWGRVIFPKSRICVSFAAK